MVFQTIRRMLAEILGMEETMISPGTRLWRAVDAVSLAKLILACEQRFRITIHDERVPGFRCLRDLAQHVEQCISEGRDDYKLPSDSAREAWYYE